MTTTILPGNWAEVYRDELRRGEAVGLTAAEAYQVIDTGTGFGHYLASREAGVPHAEAMRLAATANVADSLADRPSQWV